MTQEELKAAFDHGLTTVKEQLQKKQPPAKDAWQGDLLLAGVLILQEFLVDHKRIADALTVLASNSIDANREQGVRH